MLFSQYLLISTEMISIELSQTFFFFKFRKNILTLHFTTTCQANRRIALKKNQMKQFFLSPKRNVNFFSSRNLEYIFHLEFLPTFL